MISSLSHFGQSLPAHGFESTIDLEEGELAFVDARVERERRVERRRRDRRDGLLRSDRLLSGRSARENEGDEENEPTHAGQRTGQWIESTT